MYCPKCGKENPEDQKFCRSCGLALRDVSMALSNSAAPAPRGEGLAETVRNEIVGWRSPLIYAGLLLISGITVSSIGDRLLHNKSASDIGMLIALVGVLVLLLKGLMLVAGGASKNQEQSRNLPTVEKTKELSRHLLSAEPPSVTEHTTRQLDAVLEGDGLEDAGRSRDTQPTI